MVIGSTINCITVADVDITELFESIAPEIIKIIAKDDLRVQEKKEQNL